MNATNEKNKNILFDNEDIITNRLLSFFKVKINHRQCFEMVRVERKTTTKTFTSTLNAYAK